MRTALLTKGAGLVATSIGITALLFLIKGVIKVRIERRILSLGLGIEMIIYQKIHIYRDYLYMNHYSQLSRQSADPWTLSLKDTIIVVPIS